MAIKPEEMLKKSDEIMLRFIRKIDASIEDVEG